MKITPDDADDYLDNGDLDFNVALRAWNLSLTTMRTPREIIRELPDHPNLAERRFTAFVEAWTRFKKENHLFDFMDMLTTYANEGTPWRSTRPSLTKGQDLSKLQWVCVEKMFAKAERIYMAGDDDQAIYTFLGGSEYGFLEHGANEDEVLTQSYRCPQAVGREADRIIRKIAHRKDKAVQWRPEEGAVSRMNQDVFGMPWRVWQRDYDSVMVLNRHRKGRYSLLGRPQGYRRRPLPERGDDEHLGGSQSSPHLVFIEGWEVGDAKGGYRFRRGVGSGRQEIQRNVSAR
jgi:hypothetical protein